MSDPGAGGRAVAERQRAEATPSDRDETSIVYLSRAEVERVGISPAEVREAVRLALAEKGRGRVESPPKRGVVPRPRCSIRAMKAFAPSLGAAGVKWVSAFPDNVERGLPTIGGLVILNDVETGLPRAVMDCTWITAVRTAACTAVAAQHLARPDSSTAGIVACGLQGRANLRALSEGFPVRRARAYDLRFEAARRFAAEMGSELGIDVEPVRSVEEAVRGLDLVVTSCPIEIDPSPVIEAGWLAPGAFAALLDFDASIRGEALRTVDRFYTDDVTQFSFFKEIGYLRDTPQPDGDLGKVVAGRLPGRLSPDETIATMNLGIGVLDLAVATLIHRRALEKGIGSRLPY